MGIPLIIPDYSLLFVIKHTRLLGKGQPSTPLFSANTRHDSPHSTLAPTTVKHNNSSRLLRSFIRAQPSHDNGTGPLALPF